MIIILLGILALSSKTQINAQHVFADGCDGDQVYGPPPYQARAYINSYGSENIQGYVDFSQSGCYEKTTITAYITGLSPGFHGIHVHALGDTSNGCDSMGSHYNPYQVSHGGQTDGTRHVGDLGNIESIDGVATLNILDILIDLAGPNSILGRSVVCHANEDDSGKGSDPSSSTTGNSGPRVACGIIGIKPN